MKRQNLRWLFGLMIGVATGTATFAADHRDAPLLLQAGAFQQDINDVYAFQSPEDARNVVFIMTVNPFIGMMGNDGTLDPNTIYEFRIDNNGNAVEDITFTFRFSRPNSTLEQNYSVQRGRTTIARGKTGDKVRVRGGGCVQVSIQDDPFFFDSGILNGSSGGGNDTFAGANITAIVLEVPRRTLGPDNIAVWSTTELRRNQCDRVGRPAINTVLISSGSKNAFNQGDPADDVADFNDEVVNNIVNGFGRTQMDAQGLADVLLPDVLTIDTSNPGGFLNGRGLADDVIDAELQLLSGNGAATDGVPMNDGVAFPDTFPYLTPPHPQIP